MSKFFLSLLFTFITFTPGVAFAAPPWVFSQSAGSPSDILLCAALVGGTLTALSAVVATLYYLVLKAFSK